MLVRPSLLVALIALPVCSTVADAQRARKPRPKPFAALSESAQRLKEAAANKLGFLAAPRDSALTADITPDALRDSVALVARSQLGARYILGAERPFEAFDCSGLVRFVMATLRIDLPRTAHEQSQRGAPVERDVAALKPGDLLTFGRGKRVTHIGVYLGEGQFVHASTSKRRVMEASIAQPGTWFRKNWQGVRRLVATTQSADSTG